MASWTWKEEQGSLGGAERKGGRRGYLFPTQGSETGGTERQTSCLQAGQSGPQLHPQAPHAIRQKCRRSE